MKCAVHPEVDAIGFCSHCGKALCAACSREVGGARYCEPCLTSLVSRPSAAGSGSWQRHPWVAFGLGWIPGMGSVYNGEYLKAVVHVAVFATLVTLDSRGSEQPLWGLATAFFICYMPVEAYISARDRLRASIGSSEPPSEPLDATLGGAPLGAVVLIALGILFLLDNFHLLRMDWVFENGWPLMLIAIGGWMLWQRKR